MRLGLYRITLQVKDLSREILERFLLISSKHLAERQNQNLSPVFVFSARPQSQGISPTFLAGNRIRRPSLAVAMAGFLR